MKKIIYVLFTILHIMMTVFPLILLFIYGTTHPVWGVLGRKLLGIYGLFIAPVIAVLMMKATKNILKE